MISQLDLSRQADLLPKGITPGSDVASIVVGRLVGIDITAGQVQVRVAGSEPVWIPAAPFIYDAGATVRIRRSPLNGGRLEFCEGPLRPGPAIVTGTILEVLDDTLRVETLGSEWELPFASSTYDVGEPVLVQRHASGFGVPQAVIGIAGFDRPASVPGDGTPNTGQSQSRQATISPQDSGSYKTASSRWDSWNTDRYGGKPALWQGNGWGSGPMIGWAGYGDQVVNLHAASIEKIWVDVIRSDTSDPDGRSVSLMGSPQGTRPPGAPDGVGDFGASNLLTPGQSQRLELPSSTYEAWRTGAVKGLRTVGSDYLAIFGWNRSGAMALTIQYTVVA